MQGNFLILVLYERLVKQCETSYNPTINSSAKKGKAGEQLTSNNTPATYKKGYNSNDFPVGQSP